LWSKFSKSDPTELFWQYFYFEFLYLPFPFPYAYRYKLLSCEHHLVHFEFIEITIWLPKILPISSLVKLKKQCLGNGYLFFSALMRKKAIRYLRNATNVQSGIATKVSKVVYSKDHYKWYRVSWTSTKKSKRTTPKY
jgi:hypothetical protein